MLASTWLGPIRILHAAQRRCAAVARRRQAPIATNQALAAGSGDVSSASPTVAKGDVGMRLTMILCAESARTLKAATRLHVEHVALCGLS